MTETVNAETGEIINTPPPIRNANPLTRVRVAKHFTSPSLAKQSFREECNINNIMRKYEKSGIIEHLNTHKGDYGNFIGFESYHQSMNKILEANEAFASIPSRIRQHFNNDPETFLQFAQNPENLDQMIEMGLAHKRPAELTEEEKAETGVATPETTAAEAAAAAEAAKAPPAATKTPVPGS